MHLKLIAAEEIELRSLRVRVWHLILLSYSQVANDTLFLSSQLQCRSVIR